ncbi:hypothetical protein VTO42DRAFT_4848 [Malbranchea cinnamomea]
MLATQRRRCSCERNKSVIILFMEEVSVGHNMIVNGFSTIQPSFLLDQTSCRPWWSSSTAQVHPNRENPSRRSTLIPRLKL